MTRADCTSRRLSLWRAGQFARSLQRRFVPLEAGSARYSVRFADRHYDETEHQRRMVSHLGTNHVDTLVSNADIGRVFPEVILHTERPVTSHGSRTIVSPLTPRVPRPGSKSC